jgi:hypothetical protein
MEATLFLTFPIVENLLALLGGFDPDSDYFWG